MRRLHYLDPQLVGLDGHYFHYCERAVRELKGRGIGISIYGRRGCNLVCAGMPVQPLFSRDIFAEAWHDPETWALENYHNLNRAFLAELLQIPPDGFSADDIVFFPSLIENQLHAVAQWLGRLPHARRPSVVVLLRFLDHVMEFIQVRPHHDLVPLHYRHAGRALASVQPRSLICADTAEMVASYRKIIGLPVLRVPIAMDPSPDAVTPGRRSPRDGRPAVAFLGHTSKLRGFHLLPEIIARCRPGSKSPRFVVQVQNRSAALAEGLDAVLEKLDTLPRDDLTIVEGSLPSADYFSLLAESDVILLPYAPAFYGHSSSGIFAEAAATGKVIVVPAGTVGAKLAGEYELGVVEAAGWNPKSLAKALDEALRDLPGLSAKARVSASRFCREQGTKAFWDQILPAIARQVSDGVEVCV